MAATVQATITNGASTGTDASAESGGLTGGIGFGRDDAVVATTPVPKPNASGTNYSWAKFLSLKVTAGGGSTSLLNRKVAWATAPTTGLTGDFLTTAPSSYTQQTAAAVSDNGTTNDAAPSLYTQLSTSYQVYDSATVAAVNATKNGKFCQTLVGVSNLYLGGAGSAIALPNVSLQYDEQ